ncbi:hypothetical protein ASG90_01200 [Nocardioides sp. Soil797]|nr:hypothetical protein ASG90_01200 [Nocardioides sp. Soil797]
MVPPPDETREQPESFGLLESLLLTADGIEAFLQELVGQSSALIEPAMSCGITTQYDGQPLTVASSDGKAAALDEAQYALDEGPCLHAMRTAEVVDLADVEQAARWPLFLKEARNQGLQSSLSLPLIVQEQSIGALNLYSFDTAHDFGSGTRTEAEQFAAQASTALFLALRQVRSDQTAQQLEQALTHRSVIDQALGIVMGQQGCSADEAFVLLRTHSQNNNKKLRIVAEELVARTVGRRTS